MCLRADGYPGKAVSGSVVTYCCCLGLTAPLLRCEVKQQYDNTV